MAIVDFEGGLNDVGDLDGLGEALLDVEIIDLEACAEHDVEVLVGVQTDLVFILVQIGQHVVCGRVGEALPYESAQGAEIGFL